MPDIMRLKDVANPTLDEVFLAADQPSELGVVVASGDIESAAVDFDTQQLDALLAQIGSEFNQFDTAMDAKMVVALHRALPFSRQQAADRRIWHWLGAVHAPDFVAWRWKPSGAEATRSAARYTGDRVRQTFARLWWAAELTRMGDDYSLTNRLFSLPGFQDVYEAIFGRAIANYRPAVQAFLETVEGRKEQFIREYSKQLGYVFSLSLLETMSEQELVPFMKQLAADMDT